MMHSCDAVIVGGGLAGSSIAILLAEAGRSVTLLEKTKSTHDKVCGEFLSAEALHYLCLLGVDAAGLGAKPVRTMSFVRRHRATQQSLPFAAMSLTRRALDEALLARAAQAGAEVVRGSNVDSLVLGGGQWTARTANGEAYAAPHAVAASGKHELRGHVRTSPSSTSLARHDGLIGFKMYLRLSPAQATSLQGTVEVYLFRGGYAGLQLVEDGTANLCLLVQGKRFHQLGSAWPKLVEAMCLELPQLACRLHAAEQMLPKPLALSHIPYGYRRKNTQPGLWAVGDQAAVIPSFSGDGMSIALHSAFTAAQAMLAGTTAGSFQRDLHRQLQTPVRIATAVSRILVGAPLLTGLVPFVPGILRQVALRTRVPMPHACIAPFFARGA